MKCPKCGAEIKDLRNIVSGTMEYVFMVDKDGKCAYGGLDFEFIETENMNEFWCPVCDEVLFTVEEDAIDFLMGV
jgi:predicted RNA-binding Zn-ribbon protein involved in translation (DUF1610 family)